MALRRTPRLLEKQNNNLISNQKLSTNTVDNARKVTTVRLQQMKEQGEKIAMLTAYDYSMARLVDAAGIDVILVGDSAANVMAGYSTTLPITVDEMITYASGVVRGVKRSFVVCDMPFGSYQGNPDLALANAVKIIKSTGAEAVKLEGGMEIRQSIERILSAGIPVMAHLGLTPQSVNKFGGYGLRAKNDEEAEKLINDAQMLQQLGCFALVLEKIPAELAKRVSQTLRIPTIGIGAGADCDGQVLVLQDMLGLNGSFAPKFLRKYADLGSSITSAIGQYVSDVKAKDFPNASEQY